MKAVHEYMAMKNLRKREHEKAIAKERNFGARLVKCADL